MLWDSAVVRPTVRVKVNEEFFPKLTFTEYLPLVLPCSLPPPHVLSTLCLERARKKGRYSDGSGARIGAREGTDLRVQFRVADLG